MEFRVQIYFIFFMIKMNENKDVRLVKKITKTVPT